MERAPTRRGGLRVWRTWLRPAETATLGSAAFLVATALLPAAAGSRVALLLAALAVASYSLVWYRVLPTRAFGEWSYEVAGAFIQLVGLFTILVTGGVTSLWFPFYLLPLFATVFSSRPRATVFVSAVAVLGIVGAALAVPLAAGDAASTRDIAFLRLLELAAVASMAILISRAMHRSRTGLLRREEELREALAATEREALTDPLTGVHNRRSLEQALLRVTSRAERDAHPYALLVVDVDGLKALNDRAGHVAGDSLLRLVARAATEAVRAYDLVARFGGDEFVVVIHHTTDESAHRTAERIQQRFAELLAEAPELSGTTISMGAATWSPGRAASDLMAEADAEMYGGKRGQGRRPHDAPAGREARRA
ncbi:MAG: hypothetical protein A3H36_04435 [Chloroflexi bacterium RIFCSPLOWO2_02_FULL_71_16]|nr:MAG: hypothetical protein A3H36_04435 [Chloroflexi bacterium RIFCSPLOWO2_02_FULL_71_16]